MDAYLLFRVLQFVDPVTNEECGVSEVGEIWCRGPQNMMGYVKNQKATDETIDREGWLHTGQSPWEHLTINLVIHRHHE